jgi:cytochrome P450
MTVGGSVDTTTSLTSAALLHLFRFPDDRRRLLENPELLDATTGGSTVAAVMSTTLLPIVGIDLASLRANLAIESAYTHTVSATESLDEADSIQFCCDMLRGIDPGSFH